MRATSAVMARTRPTLAMLEPSALPTAISPAPEREALSETRISGAEVPNDTTVKPIIIGVTPRLRAKAAAPATNRSADQIKPAKPIKMAIAAT